MQNHVAQHNISEPGNVRLAPQDDSSSLISALDLDANTHESAVSRLIAVCGFGFPACIRLVNIIKDF